MSLGLYHVEGANLRAKRLAVRATEETLALKPSPFTIATEDYLYSFRIVAWTAPKAVEEALQLVKFTTSNEGQEVVAKQGFIDLRLIGKDGDVVPPEILAALGAAIGSNTISSSIRLSTNFRFETGKSLLDLKAQADLERLPRFVFEKYPTHKVVILGFTDSDGGPDINMPLSKDRAEAVSTELRRSKVDARSAGLGPVFPVDTNATEAGNGSSTTTRRRGSSNFGRSWCGCSTRTSTSRTRKSARPTNASPRRSTKPATRKKGDIDLLEHIAKDPQAFIRQQGWASVSLDGDHSLSFTRSQRDLFHQCG